MRSETQLFSRAKPACTVDGVAAPLGERDHQGLRPNRFLEPVLTAVALNNRLLCNPAATHRKPQLQVLALLVAGGLSHAATAGVHSKFLS